MISRINSVALPVVLAATLACAGPQEGAVEGEAVVAHDAVAPADASPTGPAPAPGAPVPGPTMSGDIQHSFNRRPADVTVVMSTSRGRYDGTYTSSQTASVCGEVPAQLNFAGVASFVVEFPYELGDFAVTSVSFGSAELVGGVTTSAKFHLTVGVKSPQIGQPPLYALHTDQPKMTGTATLTTGPAGMLTLKVEGVNDRGETVKLTMGCGPTRD